VAPPKPQWMEGLGRGEAVRVGMSAIAATLAPSLPWPLTS
jgi:hypothetical protein